MNKIDRRLAGLLLGIGVGIALAVSLDNIAIGIGVGVALTAGFLVAERNKGD